MQLKQSTKVGEHVRNLRKSLQTNPISLNSKVMYINPYHENNQQHHSLTLHHVSIDEDEHNHVTIMSSDESRPRVSLQFPLNKFYFDCSCARARHQ